MTPRSARCSPAHKPRPRTAASSYIKSARTSTVRLIIRSGWARGDRGHRNRTGRRPRPRKCFVAAVSIAPNALSENSTHFQPYLTVPIEDEDEYEKVRVERFLGLSIASRKTVSA